MRYSTLSRNELQRIAAVNGFDACRYVGPYRGEDIFLLVCRPEHENLTGLSFTIASRGKEHRVESHLGFMPDPVKEAGKNARNHCFSEQGYFFLLSRRQIAKRARMLKDSGSIMADDYHHFLRAFGGTARNYYDYVSTDGGMNPDREMERLPDADFLLCCVLLVLLLREDHFSSGSFSGRVQEGTVSAILERMLVLLDDSAVDICASDVVIAPKLDLEGQC